MESSVEGYSFPLGKLPRINFLIPNSDIAIQGTYWLSANLYSMLVGTD